MRFAAMARGYGDQFMQAEAPYGAVRDEDSRAE